MKVLNNALLAFDPSYDPETRSKLRLQQMKKIAEFMNSPDHCIMSDYLLEYLLYSVPGCEIFAGMGLEVRTPHIYVCEYNLSNEVLRWDECPIIDSSDSETDLYPEATSDYIKHKNITSNPKKGDKEKNYIAEARDRQIFQFRQEKGQSNCFLG